MLQWKRQSLNYCRLLKKVAAFIQMKQDTIEMVKAIGCGDLYQILQPIFQFMLLKEDKLIARIGKNLLACESDLFKIWHEFKAEKILRYELFHKANSIRKRTGELLEQGSYTDPKLKVARFCKNLLENFNALWTFLECDNVAPTNNHAERSLRPSVIWRKKYFFT